MIYYIAADLTCSHCFCKIGLCKAIKEDGMVEINKCISCGKIYNFNQYKIDSLKLYRTILIELSEKEYNFIYRSI